MITVHCDCEDCYCNEDGYCCADARCAEVIRNDS